MVTDRRVRFRRLAAELAGVVDYSGNEVVTEPGDHDQASYFQT